MVHLYLEIYLTGPRNKKWEVEIRSHLKMSGIKNFFFNYFFHITKVNIINITYNLSKKGCVKQRN